MEYLIKIINYLGYSQVTIDSDPVVLYAASILVLTILALVGVFYMLINFIFIILGYNQAFLAILNKWVSSKWLNRIVTFHRAYSIYTILLESACIIAILVNIITTSSGILSNYL